MINRVCVRFIIYSNIYGLIHEIMKIIQHGNNYFDREISKKHCLPSTLVSWTRRMMRRKRSRSTWRRSAMSYARHVRVLIPLLPYLARDNASRGILRAKGSKGDATSLPAPNKPGIATSRTKLWQPRIQFSKGKSTYSNYLCKSWLLVCNLYMKN